MYFSDVVRLLLRRWLIVLIGAGLTVGAGLYVMKTVPTQYQANGELVLLLPPDATGKVATNPYLNLPGELTTAASLLSGEVMTDDAARQLAASGYTASYSVALSPGTGPILVVSAEDTDPAKALATRDGVIALINANLREMQTKADAPTRQVIYASPSSIARTAVALHGSKIRALAGVGGVGVGLTLAVAFLLDRLLSRRKRNDQDGHGDDEDRPRADRSTPGLREATRTADHGEAVPVRLTRPARTARAIGREQGEVLRVRTT